MLYRTLFYAVAFENYEVIWNLLNCKVWSYYLLLIRRSIRRFVNDKRTLDLFGLSALLTELVYSYDYFEGPSIFKNCSNTRAGQQTTFQFRMLARPWTAGRFSGFFDILLRLDNFCTILAEAAKNFGF